MFHKDLISISFAYIGWLLYTSLHLAIENIFGASGCYENNIECIYFMNFTLFLQLYTLILLIPFYIHTFYRLNHCLNSVLYRKYDVIRNKSKEVFMVIENDFMLRISITYEYFIVIHIFKQNHVNNAGDSDFVCLKLFFSL